MPVVPLQRLSAAEYLNTQRALFQQPSLTLSLDSVDAASPVITQLEAQKVSDAAATAVASGGYARFLTCSVTGPFDDTCAQAFIQAFGLRAFRRPVTGDEISWLMGVYQTVKGLSSLSPAPTFRDAVEAVAQVMIQAPQHLYVSPQGVSDPSLPPGINRTTGYERATRIAYALTESTPDEALLQAAGEGKLDSVEGVRAEAQRLLDSTAGHRVVRSFVNGYLGLEGSPIRPALEDIPKDPLLFPMDSPALRTAMRQESQALYEHAFYDLGGKYSALMTSTDAYVNGPLASLYGVTGPADPNTFSWVSLDQTQRAGVFTRAAFLAETANQQYESPIQRGIQIYKFGLCRPIGPPPPNANKNSPPVPTGAGTALSVRQATDLRTAAASCQGCHSQFNPIGYTLDNYDAMGRWQTSETGSYADGGTFTVPVDAVATIPGTDLQGSHSGGVGLSQALAASQEAMGCMAQQWLTKVAHRPLAQEDGCTAFQTKAAFEASGGDMRALVIDAVSSPTSLYVRTQ